MPPKLDRSQITGPFSASPREQRTTTPGEPTLDPTHPHRILVLDNDTHLRAAIRSTLESTLGQDCTKVDLASSMQEALRILALSPFDLLITDIVLPDGNGISMLAHIRSLHPHLPILIITAVQDTATAIFAMRQGAFDYLFKPFGRSQLMASVQNLLHHSVAQRQNDDYQQSLEQAITERTRMLHQAIDELEQSCDFTIEALGDALDLRDSDTEGHSRRVTAYTVAMARAMGMSMDEVKIIARGAFLHDIGKMAIPDAILLKPGMLTGEEQAIMRLHCERGYSILRKIPFLREASEIVYAHQETYDGSGYPRALQGAEIHIGARIFSIADTLDAITSDRPYRSARSFEFALQEIARCAGTQFDPAVVNIFLQIPTSLWQDLRSEILRKSETIAGLTTLLNPS